MEDALPEDRPRHRCEGEAPPYPGGPEPLSSDAEPPPPMQQMRRSGNKDENKRILMDLDVVLKSHDCPYIVQCFGTFITNVSPPPSVASPGSPVPCPGNQSLSGLGRRVWPLHAVPTAPADGRLHCHGTHGHVCREAEEADAGSHP